jgi:hypothetical protein
MNHSAGNNVFIISVDSQPFSTFTAPWTQDTQKDRRYITQLHYDPKATRTGAIRLTHTSTLASTLTYCKIYFGTAAILLHSINI